MEIPIGFHELHRKGAFAFARSPALEWVEATLAKGITLHEEAASHDGAVRLEGRGVVYLVTTPVGRWVVRRYQRGGAMRFLGELYLRGTEARPLREARVSAAVIERGVPTPNVVAGAIYPAGLFYRADLVTEYAEGTMDLGQLLFSSDAPDARRREALEAAAHLLVDAALVGIEHPDLNAKNVLVDVTGTTKGAMLVDLDRMRLEKVVRPVDSSTMLSRLERSLWKLAGKTSRPLSASEWTALRRAVERRSAALGSGVPAQANR